MQRLHFTVGVITDGHNLVEFGDVLRDFDTRETTPPVRRDEARGGLLILPWIHGLIVRPRADRSGPPYHRRRRTTRPWILRPL